MAQTFGDSALQWEAFALSKGRRRSSGLSGRSGQAAMGDSEAESLTSDGSWQAITKAFPYPFAPLDNPSALVIAFRAF